MIRSLISTLCGWITGTVGFALHSFAQPVYLLDDVPLPRTFSSLLSDLLLSAAFSGPLFIFLWLFLLWPLYRFVPASSPLWRPRICVACGIIAGLLLCYLAGRYVYGFIDDLTHSWPQLAIGAAVGAVTCAVGSSLKHRSS